MRVTGRGIVFAHTLPDQIPIDGVDEVPIHFWQHVDLVKTSASIRIANDFRNFKIACPYKIASSGESVGHRRLRKCAKLVKKRDFPHVVTAISVCTSHADLGLVVAAFDDAG